MHQAAYAWLDDMFSLSGCVDAVLLASTSKVSPVSISLERDSNVHTLALADRAFMKITSIYLNDIHGCSLPSEAFLTFDKLYRDLRVEDR